MTATRRRRDPRRPVCEGRLPARGGNGDTDREQRLANPTLTFRLVRSKVGNGAIVLKNSASPFCE
jgi:hypothetical protein